MTARTVAEHRAAVAELLAAAGLDPADPVRLGAERLMLDRAALAADAWLGRLVAEDVVSERPMPLFDNSQMDGYAVRAADLADAAPGRPVELAVEPAIVAGETGAGLAAGSAAPIMTGAPVPPGADAVVPIEQVDPPRFGPHDRVRIAAPVAPGTFVRRSGSDAAAGELLLPAGAPLTPAALGVLASAGRTEVQVRRRVRVLLTVTGHEVRAPGTPLRPGQIPDANSFSLWLAVTESGADVSVVPCETDDPARLAALLAEHAARADLVITVGGVSAGAREVVRDVLEPKGVWFGSVAMQPGGPQGLGMLSAGIPVLAFPGNPVSCLVSFEMFLRPALRALAGAEAARAALRAPLADALDSPAHKHQVRRGEVDAAGRVRLIGGPSSHLLHAYARSTVLVHLPVGVSHLDAGDDVEIWRIDGR